MAVPARSLRVEFIDFQNVGDHRDYRFQVSCADEPAEVRIRVAMGRFGPGGLRLQDGPDACYQRLLRAVGDGETALPEVILLDDADLASYREAHTPVVRSRAASASTPRPALPPKPARTFVRTPSRPTAAPEVTKAPVPVFAEGQRVRHAVFGVGVTSSSTEGHTVVHFDEAGPKTFITSLLEMDALSAPHTWETGPRGVNRAVSERVERTRSR